MFTYLILAAGSGRVSAQGALTGKTVHLLSPYGGAKVLIGANETGREMAAEGGGWYKYAFPADWAWPAFDFFPEGRFPQLARNGMWSADKLHLREYFDAAIFPPGVNEVWILQNPDGLPNGPPLVLTHLPRQVHLFNPWPMNGPAVIMDGKRRSMSVNRAHCNWYSLMILKADAVKPYFVSVADGEAFGAGGFADNTPFDLTARLANGDVWIDTTGTITATHPGKEGTCSYQMAMMVHDMAETHPSYGPNSPATPTPSGWYATKGMVETALGADKKPVFTQATKAKYPDARFDTWFTSDSTLPMPLKGYQTCVDLTMGKSDDGLWEYDSFNNPNHSFVPIDGFNRLDENQAGLCPKDPRTKTEVTGDNLKHNFGFCTEVHATFVYQKGQTFEFAGDDDVWVYIDRKLAIDLGGRHEAVGDTVRLDELALTEGKQYDWDFFSCERQRCSSNIKIKTTIYFRQQRALDHETVELPGGKVNYTVFKREGEVGSCSNVLANVKIVAPSSLVYTLYDQDGTKVGALLDGLSYGGISIKTPKVDVDTALVTGLPPGRYRIVFHEPLNPKLTDEVQFTVPSRIPPKLPDPPIPPAKPVAVTEAVLRDADADGYADRAVLGFTPTPVAADTPSAAAQARAARFTSGFAPADAEVAGATVVIALAPNKLPVKAGAATVTLAPPAKPVDGYLAPGTFPLQDGVAPVLRAAILERRDPTLPDSRDRLVLVVSEPVDPAAILGEAFLAFGALRSQGYRFLVGGGQAHVGIELKDGEAAYAFAVLGIPGAQGEAQPETGDSIWINPLAGIKDPVGNIQDNPANRRVALKVKTTTHMGIRPVAADGVTRSLPLPPGDPDWSVSGGALQGMLGTGPGALPVRPAPDAAGVAAGVGGLILEATAPFDGSIQVYNNVGEFVTRTTFKVGEADFLRLGPGRIAGTRQVALLWNGKAANGQTAGSGAYVYRYSMTVHSPGEARNRSGSMTLGLLRAE